jgi:serine/threonine protein kinase
MQCAACGRENLEGARSCAACGADLANESRESEDPMVGRTIGGRYRITGVLGEGGMGIVYVGEQPMGTTMRKVAIKTLHPHLSRDPSVLARFHRECGTVAQLEHPNTIKFYDFGATDDGTLYIVMEFVSGRALNDVIAQEGRLAPERVLHIMRQVCGALDEAHEQGIIHRDLKPDNLILTNRAGETDVVKVLDFGIAGRTESTDAQKEQKLTQQGMVLGTPPYMSPEQFTGLALDRRSDVYSLAVVAYEMLSGKLPFQADTPWQWAVQHMTAEPAPLEMAGADTATVEHLRAVITRALSKDRDQRPTTAREFFAELSSGGRVTVERAGSAAHPATVAMPVPPDFGASAVAATSGMAQSPDRTGPPLRAVVHSTPAQSRTGGHLAPAVAVPAASPARLARSSSAGHKWLVPALVGSAALLAGAIAVVAMRHGTSTQGSTSGVLSVQSTAAPTTVAPQLDLESANPAPVAPESRAATGQPVAPQTTGRQGAKSSPTTGTKPPPQGSKTTAVDAGAAATEPGAATADAATAVDAGATAALPGKGDNSTDKKPKISKCSACIIHAGKGKIVAAAKDYEACDDEAQKKACSRTAGRAAPAAARQLAFNGDCGSAKTILAAAKSMGAGRAVKGALKGTPCE